MAFSDSHEALTFHPLDQPAGIGDIHSDAKGSGARYNSGKPALDLVPLRLVAQYYRQVPDMDAQRETAITALAYLGFYQERQGLGLLHLRSALAVLGDGWVECAQVFDYGRKKYAAWNWAKGMAWSIPLACAARHLLAIIQGEETDPESGLPHRGHVFCNVVMLLTFARTFPEGDDRAAPGLLAPVTGAA